MNLFSLELRFQQTLMRLNYAEVELFAGRTLPKILRLTIPGVAGTLFSDLSFWASPLCQPGHNKQKYREMMGLKRGFSN